MKRLTTLLLTVISLISNTCMSESEYQAPIWQMDGNLQTIIPYLIPPTPLQHYYRERWELQDGDFVDADWTENPLIGEYTNNQNRPVLILFHGLEGNSQSHYARTIMAGVKKKGWIGVVIHFRGCSGEPNRLPRTYYAGDSLEINNLVTIVRSKHPKSSLYAVGVSLGGNALLKWLGEYSKEASTLIQAAVSISAPIDLKETAHTLDEGLNYWLYSRTFVSSMKPKALEMANRFPDYLDKEKIMAVKTVQDMDNAVTSVLFGAINADDYYDLNASKQWLKEIEIPTLILNARNDPFVPFKSLPKKNEVSSYVTLDYPKQGGHAGFSGKNSSGDSPWLSDKVIQFLEETSSLKLDNYLEYMVERHSVNIMF